METRRRRRKRIFLSYVDRYSSRHIAEYLSTCAERDDAEEDDDGRQLSQSRSDLAFQIVGTVSGSGAASEDRLDFLTERYKSPSREELLSYLMACDAIIYNVSENVTQDLIDEATWAISTLRAEVDNFRYRKTFILVSSVMTWAMSKPQNPDGADVVTEDDYIRRRPHPRFRKHNNLEKLVLRLGRVKKNRLKGYVLNGGLQYGKGENIFHYFFKVSWLNLFAKVPLFGSGTNYIPTIHVYDLAGVIQCIIEMRPRARYVLAISDGKTTLEEIIQTISNWVGPGKIERRPEADALAMNAFKPEDMLYLSINLRMEALIVNETLGHRWYSPIGIVQDIERVVEEYKHTRQLLPFRVCLIGPPAVGKTTVAEKLCSHYKIHHIKVKAVIEEKIAELMKIVEMANADLIRAGVVDAIQKQLEDITVSMEMNDGELVDDMLFGILKEKLGSMPCRNQGFLLDGFPETYEQAKLIFAGESDNYDSLSKVPVYNSKITPEHVFVLNAADEFLIERVKSLPESVAQEMGYTQEEFTARLAKYRELSKVEETVMSYFDELEIHPEYADVNSEDQAYTEVMEKITELVGTPKNYGLTPEELEEEQRREAEESRQRVIMEAAERRRRNVEELTEMSAQYDEWLKNTAEVYQQESELVEVRALPLRNYLMKYVIPSFTEAMLESSKIKPDDPIDFLAEYLFRKNKA